MIKNSQQSLPPNLANAISGYAWQHIDIGFASAQVFRLEAENENSLYLKIDSRASKFSLRQEKINLEWLENRLLVSEVLLFAEDETNEYLLLSEIPGVNASDDSLKNDIPRTIEQLASGLKMIHKLSIENCPFD